ncbi:MULTISPECIES: prolyl oligopeptidase family serine peptidase [unclassified Carboxylicivirga]|uniref:S9 family peptidase n=1 Tax=Carboxylicivirga TaxID=1628153 RepID=UPI003D34468C
MNISFVNMITMALLGWLIALPAGADEKKKLDASVYDGWKSIDRGYSLSNDGSHAAYVIKPQKGDSYLYVYKVSEQRLDSVPRGVSPVFSCANSFIAFTVKPQADTIRALKLKKTKKDKMPKDSLFIRLLDGGQTTRITAVKEWRTPEKGGNWLAYMLEEEVKKKETAEDTLTNKEGSNTQKKEKAEAKEKKSKKAFKSKGKPLVFYRPTTGDSLYVEKVSHYALAENGTAAYVVQSMGDTAEVSKVLRFNPASFNVDTLFTQIGKIEKVASANNGEQCAFYYSPDTADTKLYRLYHYGTKMKAPRMIIDTIHPNLPSQWAARTKGKLKFSENGERLFFEAGERPASEPKDTLTADEKTHLDIWNWKDVDLQPMQKKNMKRDKDPTYDCVYHIRKQQVVQLGNTNQRTVEVPDEGNAQYGILYDSTPYRWARTYSGRWSADVYRVDMLTGEKTLLLNDQAGKAMVSPKGDWMVYYKPEDGQYYSLYIKTGASKLISGGADVNFADELNDTPNQARAYGVAGFSADGKHVLVYDRYDIWKLSLSGKSAALCLTNRQGRKHTTEYRYVKLDKEAKTIDLSKEMLLITFNDVNKQAGFTRLEDGDLQQMMMGDYRVYAPRKAREANVMVWRKSTFKQYPELLISEGDLNDAKVISNTNPQQSDYIWGNIQLVDWVASDGLTHQGLLITPENLDPKKKYPMISYFYERYSDNLHGYRPPAPSRSTVNWNFYASNGYVIFVPDIFYRDGDPGLCAYEAVVSGCLAMADRYPFIDRDNMGIQGQSWGGYQVAHLVTRTNLFKAGMAGAPVSNMTSAYGGIRWGSGMSRQFQYERTQSRIGGTLWEKTSKYIENSPVFFAPQVETPLLMMHNDQDGAVPWYQGIEYYMALRRLEKPVWMLVYNDEQHNLTRRANSKDLSIRMMQFFDHYLKGELMPVWMHDGIPAVKKGKELGYDLVE